MALKKYKLNVGTVYHSRDGRIYGVGDVVELTEKFVAHHPGSYEEVHEEEKVTKGKLMEGVSEEEEEKEEEGIADEDA